LVRKNSKGYYQRTSAVLTASPMIDASVIHNFQYLTMQLAASSLHRFSKEQRDVSTVTISCDQHAFKRIAERVAAMRSEILEIACECTVPDQVFQVNTQIFPLSGRSEESDHA
jgi:uncharacterized protein (TIGR02147 family)